MPGQALAKERPHHGAGPERPAKMGKACNKIPAPLRSSALHDHAQLERQSCATAEQQPLTKRQLRDFLVQASLAKGQEVYDRRHLNLQELD